MRRFAFTEDAANVDERVKVNAQGGGSPRTKRTSPRATDASEAVGRRSSAFAGMPKALVVVLLS